MERGKLLLHEKNPTQPNTQVKSGEKPSKRKMEKKMLHFGTGKKREEKEKTERDEKGARLKPQPEKFYFCFSREESKVNSNPKTKLPLFTLEKNDS